jgi:DNA replication and repair protein RecF
MAFSFLRTVNFRNLVDTEVNIQGKDVFLIGENGQGKTNFLEALYFCSYASSFRVSKEEELVKNGEKDCSVMAKLLGPFHERIQVKIEKSKKHVILDGKAVEDRKYLLSVVPCIVFCHEDMEFVSGSPEERRRFFDQTQSLYDIAYLDDLRKYRKILKNRNVILKGGSYGADDTILGIIDPQLAEFGLRLMEKRVEAVKDFSEIFGLLYKEVSGIDGVSIKYCPSWKDGNNGNIEVVIARLKERWDQEKALGVSLSGPHRDKFIFVRGESEFSAKASTGQRRLLALLLRAAQARRFSLMTGKNPVLLLDDALLELDPEKRRKFLACMPAYDQAFYTFLPGEPYQQYQREDTLVYHVVNGRLS